MKLPQFSNPFKKKKGVDKTLNNIKGYFMSLIAFIVFGIYFALYNRPVLFVLVFIELWYVSYTFISIRIRRLEEKQEI